MSSGTLSRPRRCRLRRNRLGQPEPLEPQRSGGLPPPLGLKLCDAGLILRPDASQPLVVGLPAGARLRLLGRTASLSPQPGCLVVAFAAPGAQTVATAGIGAELRAFLLRSRTSGSSSSFRLFLVVPRGKLARCTATILKKRATLNVRRRKRGRSRHPAAGSSPLACCWSPPTRRRRDVSHTCGFVLAASHFFSSPTASCLSTFGWHKAQRVTRLLSVSVPPSDLGRPRCRAAESRRYREHIHARARRRSASSTTPTCSPGLVRAHAVCRPRCRPRPVKTAD